MLVSFDIDRMKDKPFPENLTNIFELKLPGPPSVHMNDQQTECGICYAQYLPTGNANYSIIVFTAFVSSPSH